jgi:hypothetical protein
MLAQFLEYISLFDEIDQCMDAHLFWQKIEEFEKFICQPLERVRQLNFENWKYSSFTTTDAIEKTITGEEFIKQITKMFFKINSMLGFGRTGQSGYFIAT